MSQSQELLNHSNPSELSRSSRLRPVSMYMSSPAAVVESHADCQLALSDSREGVDIAVTKGVGITVHGRLPRSGMSSAPLLQHIASSIEVVSSHNLPLSSPPLPHSNLSSSSSAVAVTSRSSSSALSSSLPAHPVANNGDPRRQMRVRSVVTANDPLSNSPQSAADSSNASSPTPQEQTVMTVSVPYDHDLNQAPSTMDHQKKYHRSMIRVKTPTQDMKE